MTENRLNNLLSNLKGVWWRGQMLHVTAGLLALLRWGIPLLLAGMLIDWLIDLPSLGRVVILIVVLGVSIYKAWQGGWRYVASFSPIRTALQVETRLGGLESLLVTAVQFGDKGSYGGMSESLRDVTLQRAEEAGGRFHAKQVVGFGRLGRPAMAVLALAAIIGVLALIAGPLLYAGMTRLFAPWVSINYPTRTKLELVTGDMVVKEGDRAQIAARLSGSIPRQAKLALRTGTGSSRLHELNVADSKCEYTMDSVFRGFEYRIIAGDAKSEWHTVQVIPPPRIESAEVSLEFPAYTERPTETGEALTVVVPENTGVSWRLKLDRAVSKALFTTGDNESLPLDISADGRVVTMKRNATESRAYSFSWVERDHGFAFTSPRYYVQVSPDQRPNVELTSPRADLYATLGRKIDLAFRGRDDYGFGESVISYRVNKTAEVNIPFPAPKVHDGSEQRIEWDYRTALPDLAVGDSLTIAIELADRYPGPNGPHRARSDARRITFLSQEEYLQQIAKQKQRLLSQLQNIYREERAVHDVVRRLDPLADTFVQTCQLEAVRQDLMRDRLTLLAKDMQFLIDDLAANNITDEKYSVVLGQLGKAIQTIADDHVGAAANNLRSLASSTGKRDAIATADPTPAVLKINSAARELGLLVLELGYKDASEVMARELHATAQTQATLRLKTLIPGKVPSDAPAAVAEAQDQLAQWLTRLLAATPREQETTVFDALLAFNLSRLSKNMIATGAPSKMTQSVALIRNGGVDEAAKLQVEVIHTLLSAEFRLRYGSEFETLSKAKDALTAEAESLKTLRGETATLSPEDFKRRQSELARTQAALRRELQLLLVPAIPAKRARLFDAELPSAPPVSDLMAAAESAMKKAAAHIDSADQSAIANEQQQAEKAINALAEVVRERIDVINEIEHMATLIEFYSTGALKLSQFRERQLGLLEKTTDAAADNTETGYLAVVQQKLLRDLESLRAELLEKTQAGDSRQAAPSPLQQSFDKIARAMTDAEPALRVKQSPQARKTQKAAVAAIVAAMKEGESILSQEGARVAALSKVTSENIIAQAPGPYVGEIVSEQRDLIAATQKAKPAEYQALVTPQKNLVHAVNAVLSALDAVAHKVESGTDMLFAKTDMDSAAAALEAKDVTEANDAQTAVADSVSKLQARLQAVTPQYGYILEIVEFIHDNLPEASNLLAAQAEVHAKMLAAADDSAVRNLASEQSSLEARAKSYGELLYKVTGQERYLGAAKSMADVTSFLKGGDKASAEPLMVKVEETLSADKAELLSLLKLLATILGPPTTESDQLKLLLNVIPTAALQRNVCIQTRMIAPDQSPSLLPKLQEIEKQCEAYIPLSGSHPKLVEAKQQLSLAESKLSAKTLDESVACQQKASEAMRHFVLEYVTKYAQLPPPPSSSDVPGDPTEIIEQDVSIFMPGAVSGKPPKNGRTEWEVLGRRERAALNENFARELPLEYRAILKDYYERLTR